MTLTGVLTAIVSLGSVVLAAGLLDGRRAVLRHLPGAAAALLNPIDALRYE